MLDPVRGVVAPLEPGTRSPHLRDVDSPIGWVQLLQVGEVQGGCIARVARPALKNSQGLVLVPEAASLGKEHRVPHESRPFVQVAGNEVQRPRSVRRLVGAGAVLVQTEVAGHLHTAGVVRH